VTKLEGTSELNKGNLAPRLIVAAIMIPLALYVVWAGGWWLVSGCMLFAGIMAFEWAGMAKAAPWPVIALASALPCCVYPLWGLSWAIGALWLGGSLAALIMRGGRAGFVNTLLGVVYTGGMPLALLVLREGPWEGRSAALMLMGMVWASDSAAYFAGRLLGGPLLSPKDSPNKTWSGALGAVMATSACGLIAAHLLQTEPLRWIAFGAALSIVAQHGDLLESRIKRYFGVKDAGRILPGHGGILDRVDGLGAVCVAAMSVFLIVPGLVSYMGYAA